MSKSPTKAELIAIINTLEGKLAALATKPLQASPEESMASIEATLSDPCPKCEGTGEHTSGGICYACKGKGYQDRDDVLRNASYARARSLRKELGATSGYASPRDIPLDLKKGKRIVRLDGLFYVQD